MTQETCYSFWWNPFVCPQTQGIWPQGLQTTGVLHTDTPAYLSLTPIPTADRVNTDLQQTTPPPKQGFELLVRMKREKQHSAADEILNLHKVARLQRKRTQKVLLSVMVLQAVSTALIPSTQTAINFLSDFYERELVKGGSWWVNRKRCAFAKGTIKQIKLDQLRTVGAYTVYLMVRCAVYYAAAALSPLCVTLLLTTNRSRPWPLWSPVSPQPASRWALLMSPSRSSGVGLFFPGLEGATEGAEGVCWLGQHQAGGWR